MKNVLALALLVIATPCFAQEMGLDLSDPAKPTTTGGDDMGLDLTEAKVPEELRPNIVLLAATPQDGEEVSAARAKLLTDEILRMAKEADQFKLILTPADAKQQLGNDYAAAVACDSYECFDKVAKQLKVQRVMLAYVKKDGAGSLVTLVGFDPALPEILTTTQESGERAERLFAGIAAKSQDKKNKEFIRKMVAFLKTSLTKLSTANGKIAIDNVDPTALVTVDGVEVGTGTFQTASQRGRHSVKVTSAGFIPFEADVTVEPLGTATVKVSLRAKEIERKVVIVAEESSGPAIFKKPGLYVAAGGVVAAGVGLIFGSMAAAAQKKVNSPDGNHVVAITRAEVRQAQTQALLANVLVGVGAAAAVGGTLWVVLTPSVSAPVAAPPVPATPTGPPTEGAGFGAMLTVGGTF